MVVMTEARARELGLEPLGTIVEVAGETNAPYGISWIPALTIKKALSRSGLTVDQIDLIEINEAFAAMPMVSTKILADGDRDRWFDLLQKTNVNGGAIALGHPVGASGLRISMTMMSRASSSGRGSRSRCHLRRFDPGRGCHYSYISMRKGLPCLKLPTRWISLPGIATFTIDTAGPVNTVGQAFVADLERATARALSDEVHGVMLASGKKRSFLDGANLKEIMTDAAPGAIRHVVLRYQEALANLAKTPFPVVAILDGQTSLGGGFELLLWGCDHVFATASSKMGLPEINVGLFPVGGGTQILPRLVGFKAAVDAILTGRVSSAEDYSKTGLVTLCESANLKPEAVHWIDRHHGITNRNYDPSYQSADQSTEGEKEKVLSDARNGY